MDYDIFLNYAFPIFGIAALVAAVCLGLIKFSTWEAPGWVGLLIMALLFISGAVMLVTGFFLPWGSPI